MAVFIVTSLVDPPIVKKSGEQINDAQAADA
jgi:hypothetical protein